MSNNEERSREGGLQAPQRHPLGWRDEAFYDEQALLTELERVFDICHGCRRCFSLCKAFPTLFDLIDESETMELDGVAKSDYWRVVDQCYLCDMCFMTKCPYVPPHPFNLDFSHLMLRAKAVRARREGVRFRDRVLSSTDALGRVAARPVVAPAVNALNRNGVARRALEVTLGVHRSAALPEYQSRPLGKRLPADESSGVEAVEAGETCGRVALFATCFGHYNDPSIDEDLIAVYRHNGIPVRVVRDARCCGMPKLEHGDLEAVESLKNANVPLLAALASEGWDLVAPIPSCVLMFRQELPLMFPEDEDVLTVRDRFYDPCEYLAVRHREGRLNTEFKSSLGKVAYHVACHQRAQNIGRRTRDLLALVPGTEVVEIERCSGHDGTYAVKRESHEIAVKLVKPVVERVRRAEADRLASDCVLAGRHIEHGLGGELKAENPMALLRKAYGI